MTETIKTAAFLGAAAVLVLAASITNPERRAPELFSDEGQAFYPEFRDPQAVKAIEVVDYDESTATARPLKVELRKTRWVVATNHDYPIDIGERLVKTAGALMDLRRDQVRSELVQDHAKYGVVDPLDQKAASLQGRGKRVTLRDEKKAVLADYIFGKHVEGKTGWRYVRVPGAKRTYAVKTEADPSARFSDWVNAGLLRLPSGSIRKITIITYAVNSMTGALERPETVVLTQDKGQWSSPDGAVKLEAARALAATLDGLKISGARPKPAQLAEDLRSGQMRLSMETAVALRQFGFFLTPNGRILASDGEMIVEMADGTAYQIRFGDVAASGPDAKPEGGDRYLFATASFDAARAARYGDSSGGGEKTARDLNARFAGWFYVLPNVDFQKLRLTRSQALR